MTTTALNKKFEEIENKIPGIASFLTIPEMDRLKKISFCKNGKGNRKP